MTTNDAIESITRSWANRAVLPETERVVLAEAFWALLTGSPISVTGLAERLGLLGMEVEPQLQSLAASGCLQRTGDGAVARARGLMTDSESRHRLTTEYGTVNTQCTVDALGITGALGIAARINDSCALCSQVIDATITQNGEVTVRPVDAVVSMATASECCAESGIPTMCAETNFFCTPEHAKEWQRDRASLAFALISPRECVIAGAIIWKELAPGTKGANPSAQ